MPPKAKAAGKGRGPEKRKLAEEFPPGEVLTDTGKKSWKLGAPIGQGGFGLLYLADEHSSKTVGAGAPYVIKVEPSDNGPLFSELKFYMRAAKPDLIQSWMKSHKMKYLGVPKYWGSGLHEKGGKSHNNPNQVYLVDYGLAYRYSPEGILKEYKEDPKRCHDGTIEFTSIDAHKGVYELQKFMEEVKTLSYTDKPAYQKLRSILEAGLKSIGAKDDDKLEFSSVNGNGARPLSSAKKTTKRKKAVDYKDESNDETDGTPAKKIKAPKKKEVNGVKRVVSPKKKVTLKKSAVSPKKTLVEMGTQTTPGLKRGRGRPKKKADPGLMAAWWWHRSPKPSPDTWREVHQAMIWMSDRYRQTDTAS
ncbi:unnamed protein product [Coregonus sp. 'balchen']|nr:unnamed protein product [Coregonus sp. 'balchen']